MEPFDINKAKQGANLCTADGFKARIICWDRRHSKYPLLALVTLPDGGERVYPYTLEGKTMRWDLNLYIE